MSDHALIFLAGLAGSWHCLGMCGGFVCALAGDPRGGLAAARRQLLYNAGRVTTYCFLGALAGGLAAGLCTTDPGDPSISSAQRVLAVAAGGLIIFVGLRFFGFFHGIRRVPLISFGGELLARSLRDLLRMPSPLAPLSFGVANGFLPCPLVYAFLAYAAASGGPVPGMAIMLAFGLGTFPAMLAMGGLGVWLQRRAAPALVTPVGTPPPPSPFHGGWRRHAALLSGLFLILLGTVTLARGLLPFHIHGPVL